MVTAAATLSPNPPPVEADLEALKARQRGAWSSGDYAVVGTTLQIVGEELCEALDLRSDQKVLDVAAGNGNVALAAARRWCDVVATDYVPALLDRARERADATAIARIDDRDGAAAKRFAPGAVDQDLAVDHRALFLPQVENSSPAPWVRMHVRRQGRGSRGDHRVALLWSRRPRLL